MEIESKEERTGERFFFAGGVGRVCVLFAPIKLSVKLQRVPDECLSLVQWKARGGGEREERIVYRMRLSGGSISMNLGGK